MRQDEDQQGAVPLRVYSVLAVLFLARSSCVGP